MTAISSSTYFPNFLLHSCPYCIVSPSKAVDMFLVPHEGIKHERDYQATKSELGRNSALRKPHANAVPAFTPSRDGPGILYSAASVSTVSSSANSDKIWDTPKTPCGQSSKTTPHGLLTPLTSPTPSRFRGSLSNAPISKLLFPTEASPVLKQQLFEKNDTSSQDDPFRRGKMFRNLTLTLDESE